METIITSIRGESDKEWTYRVDKDCPSPATVKIKCKGIPKRRLDRIYPLEQTVFLWKYEYDRYDHYGRRSITMPPGPYSIEVIKYTPFSECEFDDPLLQQMAEFGATLAENPLLEDLYDDYKKIFKSVLTLKGL